ncbi:MAG: sigma-70 family RNA polymerase sigma factor [Erysipelotrichaceae bacterium]|nr:sigma-70 family RNA polymerase sigma factor [Erysipelotrichaceae bacterium]
MEDVEIVELYWQRNEEAIRESDRKYGKYCFKIAHNVLFDRSDSEECVSDTWIKAWGSMPPNRPERRGAYLGRITRNLALNMYEKLTADKRGSGETAVALDELSEVIGRESDVEANVDLTLLKDSINAFLRRLDKETRIIFVRRYYYLATVKEIAAGMHLSDSKVKMTLLRTREKLRVWLQEEGYEI